MRGAWILRHAETYEDDLQKHNAFNQAAEAWEGRRIEDGAASSVGQPGS